MLPLLLLSAPCPDLSGTYRLVDSDRGRCYAHWGVELTPLPVKRAIAEGDTIEIVQDGCSSFRVRYLDRTDSSLQETTRTFRIDPETSNRNRISSERRDSYGIPGLGGAGSRSLSWSLRNDRKGDLVFRFRSSTWNAPLGSGLGETLYESAHSRCKFVRVP